MEKLSDRDRRILYLRFIEDQSQSEIGDILGVTQMQVSRLLERIFRTMRAELA
jgi:RNA polymerase sigma-B factor